MLCFKSTEHFTSVGAPSGASEVGVHMVTEAQSGGLEAQEPGLRFLTSWVEVGAASGVASAPLSTSLLKNCPQGPGALHSGRGVGSINTILFRRHPWSARQHTNLCWALCWQSASACSLPLRNVPHKPGPSSDPSVMQENSGMGA